MERIRIDLSDVPETLLWNLGRRAAAARVRRPLLNDPLAIEIVDRLEHDFTDASRGASWHAVRVATFDKAVREFLTRHPAGTVVALGEGLETQFWRVDNGRLCWVTVDLPETLTLRRQLLPDGPRQHSYAGSALDNGWMDQLDPGQPALVTAQGLLMYFEREQVHELVSGIARQLPNASVVFDVVPEKMLEVARRLPDQHAAQATRLWSWVFTLQERRDLSTIPGVASVRDLTPPLAPSIVPLLLGAIRRLPRRVRYTLPVFPVIELTFR